MKNTNLQVAKFDSSISYEYNEKKRTVDSFVESCLINEASANEYALNASLFTIAGLVVKLVSIRSIEENKKTQKQVLIDFIESTYSKAKMPIPGDRDIRRKVQLARFVVDNNTFLHEFSPTPTQLINESVKIVQRYKSIRRLTEKMQEANRSSKPKQADSESVKLGKRIDALFKDIANAESSESYYRIIESMLKKARGESESPKATTKAKATPKVNTKKAA